MLWLCEMSYAITTAVVKASACFTLLRIAINRNHIFIIYGVLVGLGIFTAFFFFSLVFQCKPVTYFWAQFTGARGSCLSATFITSSSYTHSAMCIVTDWTLSTLPWFFVWDLRMSIKTKVAVVMILGLGIMYDYSEGHNFPHTPLIFNIVQARQPASGLCTSRVLVRQQTLSFSLVTSLCVRSSRRVSGFWPVLSRL